MNNAKEIAEGFNRGSGRAPKKNSDGGWQCTCPCHDDSTASLAIKDTSTGSVLMFCHAGCNYQDIRKAAESLNLLPKHKERATKLKETSEASIVYPYLNEEGIEVCRKLRAPGKKFFIQRIENGAPVNGLKGIRPPLYNLPRLLTADTIYICEGEKDADRLNKFGLVATTNLYGAGKWDADYNKYFAGKIVIICQDNDDAGRLHTSVILHHLLSFAAEIHIFAPEGQKPKEDVSDWLDHGGDFNDIPMLSKRVEKQMKEEPKAEGEDTSKYALRPSYFQVFERVLQNPRRCIFNDKLMTNSDNPDLWNPAINYLDILKSEIAVMNESEGPQYKLALVQPHFFAYEQTKQPEFLVSIPEWDGQDRISEMAYLIKLRPDSGISENTFSELLKEWCCRMFQRLTDSMVQNKILVLQGGQGLGKDTWISMLVDGLGQFAVPLAIVKEDKDTYLNLHRGLVMKISEFDKTAKAEVSTLKDIITAASTNLRSPYERDAKVRQARCSFISSANIENLLRDYTGNRRFLIFEIESIEYAYKGWTKDQIKEWQAQILAECQYLVSCKYEASQESHAEMKDYISDETPTDPADDTIEEFLTLVRSDIMLAHKTELLESELSEIRSKLKNLTGMNIRGIRSQIRRKLGYNKRLPDGRRQMIIKIPNDGLVQ